VDPNFKPAYPSFLGQALQEWRWFAGLVFPFRWAPYQPPHTPQLWTLPVEFRGSMVVFLLLLCLSKAKAAIRLPFLTAFAYYCLDSVRWDTFLFVGSIIFAERSLIRNETSYQLEDLLLLLFKVWGRGAIKVVQWVFEYILAPGFSNWTLPGKPASLFSRNITWLRDSKISSHQRNMARQICTYISGTQLEPFWSSLPSRTCLYYRDHS
jgi:hypothetical protein